MIILITGCHIQLFLTTGIRDSFEDMLKLKIIALVNVQPQYYIHVAQLRCQVTILNSLKPKFQECLLRMFIMHIEQKN